MTTVTKDARPTPDSAGESGRGAAAWLEGQGRRLRDLVRRHRLFSIVLAAAVVPRVVAMLGYGPVLFRMDSFDYLWGALHLSPNVINPSGYSVFLWLLRPLHSLVLVVVLQHLMGLGVGVMVYAVLRRHGLPAWGATLAAAPVLFDPSQILIEQMVMADMLAMVLVMAAFALLLGTSPRPWRLALVGLLLGTSAIVRPASLPVILLVPAYLLFKRVGWRGAAAALVAGVVPVTAYMGWFDAVHGSFTMTNSNGLFLWTRTMSFADCAVIKPPPDLRPLCPEAQPSGLSQPVPSDRPRPMYYLWNRQAWQWQPPSHQFVPDTAAFTRANNARALRFALDAIKAQPFAYAGVVLKESVEPFTRTSDLRFTVGQGPDATPLSPTDVDYASAAANGYSTDAAVAVSQIPSHYYGNQRREPYVYWTGLYQRIIFLPGPVLGLILLAGLAGLVMPRRRSAAVLVLWLSAVVIMTLSTAEHEYTYRYVIAGVPLLCMAAALALKKPSPPEASGSDANTAGHAVQVGALHQG